MMKKLLLLVITIAVGYLVIASALQHILPQPEWRVLASQYIKTKFGNRVIYSISADAIATHPENLTPSMGGRTISDSIVFKAHEDFSGGPNIGTAPMPYPPVEIHCLVIHHSLDYTEFLLVAIHTDGQNSDWVLHDLPVNGKQYRNLINRIGCDITHW